MPEIQAKLTDQPSECTEIPAFPCGLVVFGASGDLAQKKLLVSLFKLFQQDLLSEQFYLLGCGRKGFTDESFRKKVKESLETSLHNPVNADIESFCRLMFYQQGDYSQPDFYKNIAKRTSELDSRLKLVPTHLYYLAVPPVLYASIIEMLGSSGLIKHKSKSSYNPSRLVIEKPFGRDFDSAKKLNNIILNVCDESQVYRIDHYLGKETVQNILMFRFANTIFEPVWNRNYIDHVQITIAESVGIENRAGYYEKSGALRDMFQNHILQMLALVAMEAPVSFEADSIRDEKVKALRSIRMPETKNIDKNFVRGQYSNGKILRKSVCGYRQEPGVAPESITETYAAAKLNIDNWRWKDVPFYLRAGKRLKTKDTEIAIFFKNIPHSMFYKTGLENIPKNVLIMQIQPQESISLHFQAKNPGAKICMSTLKMDFDYNSIFHTEFKDAYQRLLLDAMLGDQTLFTRYDAVETSWKLINPVLEHWQKNPGTPEFYPAGSESFASADKLIERDGHKWRKIGEK